MERQILPTYDPKLLDAQMDLELKLENTLRAEGFSDLSIFDCRDQWRRIAFSPDSREKPITAHAIRITLEKYKTNIRKSMSFRRLHNAIKMGEIHLKRRWIVLSPA